ncbi:MAG TPA: MtrB/PioB family decaheme-associated outer membrane protein [Noviherbaspirillum sp.]|nr:MtrB/PioB family decaheme-associated outer membrane protein [Noviherbaspirillum sp.]
MNTTMETRFARTVLAAAIAGIFSAPAAWAEEDVESLIRPDSEIEIGLGYTTQDSFKYGEYTGLHSSGAHLIGNVLINKRGEDDARYVEVEGRNLGLDSRSLGLRVGEQGNYGLRLEYDQIPKFGSDSYYTPFNGAGSDVLRNPGITRQSTTTAMRAGLDANMKPYDIKTTRKGVGIGFTKELAKGWDAELNYKREDKQGDKLTAAMIQGNGGGDRRVAIVPEPIDYTTDQYEALVRYSGEKTQLQFGYYASLFKNDKQSLTWDNLFTGTSHPNTGRFGLAPDNEFHQLNVSGSYGFTTATKVSGALSYGRMTQNDDFLPYSTQGAGALGPTGSLHGKVNTLHASMRLDSKLTSALHLTAGYRYDDRDNKTPEGVEFIYRSGDSLAALSASNTRRNVALDIKKQVLYADLDYYLTSATKLKFGYDYHQVDHTHEPTDGDKEHTVKTEVRHRFGDTVSSGLSYAYSDRNAGTYNGADPLATTYTDAYLRSLCLASLNPVDCGATTAAPGKSYPWLEAPGLRKYFLADRKREKVGAFVNYSPIEQLDLEFTGNFNRDKYPDTFDGLGLTRATGWMLGFDANLQATDALSGSFFASVDQSKTNQNGANLGVGLIAQQAETGTIPATSQAVTTLTDRTVTLGLGMRYKPNARYEVGGNLTHSDSVGHSRLSSANAALTTPFPNLVSRLSRVDLFSNYALKKDVTLKVRYAYERYRSDDWAVDALPNVNSISSIVGTYQSSPDYDVHFLGVSVAYKF